MRFIGKARDEAQRVLADMTAQGAAGARRSSVARRYGGMVGGFFLFVLLPTLAGAVYFGLLASDRYVAEARYAIRSGAEMPTGGLIESFLVGGGGGGTRQDADIVRDYIFSRGMLAELGKSFDLRAHYGSTDIDWLSRLAPDASEEDLLDYFETRAEVTIDPESSISTLRVTAFDAVTAKMVADHLLQLSEQLVNRMSERITVDSLRIAREELDRVEQQVRGATAALTEFRKQTRSIDPGEETSAVLGIITDLESRLASAHTELIEARSVMRNDTTQVRTLETRVSALTAQVSQERSRLANGHNSDLTTLIDRYQPLVLDQELAMQRYASALGSVEAARAEALRQQSYLIAFVSPQVPDESTEPKRAMLIATVFAASALIFAVGGLIWSAIKDHVGL